MVNDNLLVINKLSVTFRTQEGSVKALEELSFSLKRGRTLGIAGESGCGKSVLALSIMGLIPPPGKVTNGKIKHIQ